MIPTYFQFNSNRESIQIFKFLDGLRTIAILLVLARHLAHFWPTQLETNFFLTIAFNGWLGVDLFFVLSGFLIFHHLITNWQNHNIKKYIKTFFIKRCLRILPLYITIILLVVFKLVPFYTPYQEIDQNVLLNHVFFMQDYFLSPIVIPLWSLATEEKFYVLAPFLVLTFMKHKLIITIFLVLTLLTIFIFNYLSIVNNEISDYSIFFWNHRAPFHVAIKGILVGTICAIAYNTSRNKFFIYKNNVFNWIFSLSFVMLLLILSNKAYIESEDWVSANLSINFFIILSGLIVFTGLFIKNKITDFLGNHVFKIIAVLSYSLYISHITVIPLSINLANWSGLNGYFYNVYLISVYILLISLFSLILHYLVEKPFLILKSKFK